MPQRRDKLTPNAEVLGALDEIMEAEGSKVALEDLKYLDESPVKEQHKLIQRWFEEQKDWYQKLPDLLNKVREHQEGEDLSEGLQGLISAREKQIRNEIEGAQAHLDTQEVDVASQLTKALLDVVGVLDQMRGHQLEALEQQMPELKNFFEAQRLIPLLQHEKIVAEQTPGEDV